MTVSTSAVATGWLSPFSGPEKKCPKCKSEREIQIFYHSTVVVGECREVRDSVLTLADKPEDIHDETTEHLCCACMACTYSWSELTADAE